MWKLSFVKIDNDQQLADVIPKLRQLLRSLNGCIVGVNVMNQHRMLSMSRPYPADQIAKGDIISREQCQQMANDAGIAQWTMAGVHPLP